MVMLNAQQAHSEDDFSGKARPAPGRYHVVVNHAEEKGSKRKGTPGLELEFQILAGTVKDQAGKTIPLFLSFLGGDDDKTQSCIDRVTRLALSLGVLSPGEAKEVDWQDAIGRELVIEVESQDYEDAGGNKKSGTQVAFMGFWSLGNKAVSAVPKDATTPGMMALKSAANNGTKPATAPAIPAAPPAPATTKGKWSDL